MSSNTNPPGAAPSFEQEFGSPQTQGDKPSFEQEFGAQKPDDTMVGGVLKSVLPVIGQLIKNNSPGIAGVKAFSQGMTNPGGNLFTPQEESTTNHPLLQDVSSAIYDATFRPLASAFSGIQAALKTIGDKLLPGSGLGADLATIPEAFPFGAHATIGIPHAAALDSYAVRAPENVYMGTERPTIEQEQVAIQAARASAIQRQKGLVHTQQGPDVEAIARGIEPDIFKTKDELEATQQDITNKIRNPDEVWGKEYEDKLADLKEQAAEHMRAPTNLEGEELNKAVEENGKKYEAVKAQIKDLGSRQDYIKEQGEQAIQDLLANDAKLRDIAGTGKVKAAYEEAQKRISVGPETPEGKTAGEGFTMSEPTYEEPPPYKGPWDNIIEKQREQGSIAAGSEKPPSESSAPIDNPSAKFPPKNAPDKAGNLRLDLVNTPEDINDVFRDTAKENDNFMPERRGVLSNGQVLDLADAMGMPPALLDTRKIGDAFSAEKIIVATKMLVQSASEVRDAAISGDNAAYLEAKARHQMIQGHVAGVTAEAGRALQIFQALKRLHGADEAKAMGKFLDLTDKGKTPEQLKEEMKLAGKLSDSRQVAKFLEDSKSPKFKDRILYYYLNALLSGPITHLRYSVGNMFNAIATPLLEIPTAAGYGALREVLGMDVKDRVYIGEAGAQLYAMGHSATEGMRAAIEAWQNNFSAPLPKERAPGQLDGTPPIPGIAGKVIGLPMRSVASIHSFSKTLRYEQNIAGLAYRQAIKEELSGDVFTNRVSDLTSKPTDEIMESATHDALKETYMAPTDYHSFMGGVQRLTNDYAIAKIMVPFAKVGGQITKNAFLERTPLGVANKGIRDNLAGANGEIARDMQMAKMTAGLAVASTGVAMTLGGHATGSGPEDPEQRARWLLNHQPYHITVGPISISYRGGGPYAMLLGTAANMTETSQGWDGKDGLMLAGHLAEAASKDILDANFMRGVKDALDAVYHPQEYGDKYIRDFATNWLPFSVGLGQLDRSGFSILGVFKDPNQREVNDLFSAARSKIPFASEGLAPRRDMFGKPILNGSTYDDYKNDPVVQRMEALHMGIGRLENKITGVKLTDQQFDDYSRIAGTMSHIMLSSLVQGGLQFMPPAEQVLQIKRTVEKAREIARNTVKLDPANANIPQQATANKLAILNPAGIP